MKVKDVIKLFRYNTVFYKDNTTLFPLPADIICKEQSDPEVDVISVNKDTVTIYAIQGGEDNNVEGAKEGYTDRVQRI